MRKRAWGIYYTEDTRDKGKLKSILTNLSKLIAEQGMERIVMRANI